MKEIILPAHLYDRIRASAGEHGGIGSAQLFSRYTLGVPFCAHGHAWGTCTRFQAAPCRIRNDLNEPELARFLTWQDNDMAFHLAGLDQDRIPFDQWCELLNVKRGAEVPSEARDRSILAARAEA